MQRKQLELLFDVNPVYSLPRAFLVAALVKLGRVEEAKAMAKTVLECHPSSQFMAPRSTLNLNRPFSGPWPMRGARLVCPYD